MQFKDVVGQEPLKVKLVNSILENRMGHALLFDGKEGSGNLPIAIAFAQFIFCTNRLENDSCGRCSSCLKISKLVHPDIHFSFPVIQAGKIKTSSGYMTEWRELVTERPYFNLPMWYEKMGAEKKTGLIGVGESEEILKRLSLRSYEGKGKICFIWLPELMNVSASNKLLKIIEEPPEETYFFLVTHSSEEIITTILSRTQLIKVPLLPKEDIVSALISEHNLDKIESENIASISDGNYLKAIFLLGSYSDGSSFLNEFRNWMRICFKRDVKEAILWVDEIARLGREKQKALLSYGLYIFRECFIAGFNQDDLSKLSHSEKDFAHKFSSFINTSNISNLYSAFNSSIQYVDRNANPKTLFLDLSLQIFKYLKR